MKSIRGLSGRFILMSVIAPVLFFVPVIAQSDAMKTDTGNQIEQSLTKLNRACSTPNYAKTSR